MQWYRSQQVDTGYLLSQHEKPYRIRIENVYFGAIPVTSGALTYQIAEIGYCPPSLQCEARSGRRWVGAGTGTYWHESKYSEVDLVPNPLDRPAVTRIWCSMCENNQFQFPVCGLRLILYRVAFHVAQKAKEVVFTVSLKPPLWLATRFM